MGSFVDALVTAFVREAEVCGKVYNGNARFNEALCMLHAGGVGDGGEHYVAGKQRFVIVGDERRLGIGVLKRRVKRAYFGSCFGPCRKGDRLEDGMLCDQPGKLLRPCESCCTDDSYAYGVHCDLQARYIRNYAFYRIKMHSYIVQRCNERIKKGLVCAVLIGCLAKFFFDGILSWRAGRPRFRIFAFDSMRRSCGRLSPAGNAGRSWRKRV